MRGWFRQDDFPQNEVLYDHLTPRTYLTWLHRLSVRYVVLTDAHPDYSARNEIGAARERPLGPERDSASRRTPSCSRCRAEADRHRARATRR